MLLTTHYLDEAEHLAARVGVLAAGRLVAEGTPDELIGGAGSTVVRFDLPAGATAGDLDAVLPADAAVAAGRVEFTTETPDGRGPRRHRLGGRAGARADRARA